MAFVSYSCFEDTDTCEVAPMPTHPIDAPVPLCSAPSVAAEKITTHHSRLTTQQGREAGDTNPKLDVAVAPALPTEEPPSWMELRQIIGARCRRLSIRVILPVTAFVLTLWVALIFRVSCFCVTPYNDFGKFYYSGVAYIRGENMYHWWPVTPDWLTGTVTLDGEERSFDLLNLNPPHFHILLLPLLGLPAPTAFLVWLVFSAVCLLATLRLVSRELALTWTPQARQLAYIGLLGAVITVDMIQHAQLAWLLMLAVAYVWREVRHDRWLRAGAVLGVLVSVKAFFLILVPYFLLRKQFRALGLALLAAVGCLGVGVALFGIANHQSWLAALGQVSDWAWYPKNASLWAVLTRTLHDNPMFVTWADVPLPTLKLVWLVIGGVMGLLTLAVACADRSRLGLDRAFALLLVGVVLFSPLGWIYYYWLSLAPLAAVLVHWYRHRPADARSFLARQSWRWWFLALLIPGLALPIWTTIWWQPSAWATLTIGNLYFWLALAVWLTLIADGLPHVRVPGLALFARRSPVTSLNLVSQR
jgi:hypothetical protein